MTIALRSHLPFILLLSCASGSGNSATEVEERSPPLQDTAAVSAQFDRRFVVRWPASQDSLFRWTQKVLSSASFKDKSRNLQVSETDHSFAANAEVEQKYATGGIEHSLNGSVALTYRVAIKVSENSITIDLRDARLDGRRPFDPKCWVPCEPENEASGQKGKVEQYHRTTMWYQLAGNTTSHLDGWGDNFWFRLMDHRPVHLPPPPGSRVDRVLMN